MICIKCHRNITLGCLRHCDNCISKNSRRQRRKRITPKNLVRGTRWYFNRAPEIRGVVNAVHTGGYVHLQVDEKNGDFTWISTVDDFLLSWTKIEMVLTCNAN